MNTLQNDPPWVQIAEVEFVRLISESSASQKWEARQLGIDRDVVVKIFDLSHPSSIDLDDAQLAQIFGQLEYPVDVCPRVLDWGRVDNFCYQIVGFIEGRTHHELLYEGITIISFRNLIARIALVLHELHTHDIYHCDVKPENILVDKSDEVSLIDFGPDFRSFDKESSSNLGRLYVAPFTSHYVSPELKVDFQPTAQSDLYSLAAVTYQALTGELSITEKSSDDSNRQGSVFNLSKLPEQFRGYRGVLEKALQVTPGDRHSSAVEFANDLMEFENEDIEQEVKIKTQLIASKEIRLTGNKLFDMDPEAVRGITSSSSSSGSKERWLALFSAGALVLGVFWMLMVRSDLLPEPMAEFVESEANSEIEIAKNQAQSLRQDPNQGLSTVLAAYNRLLSLVPDDPAVSKALDDISTDWIASIEEAVDQGNYTFAETRLDEAELLLSQEPKLNALSIRIQNWKRAESLYEASRSQRLGFIVDEVPVLNSLIVSYQNVLRLAPAHEGAVVELKVIAAQFAQLAKEAFAVRDLTGAINFLERAQAADASIQALEDVRELLSQTKELRATIDRILDQARYYRSLGQLVSPSGQNATELYSRVLVVEPKNIVANQAIDELTASIQADAKRLFDQGDLAAADGVLIQALMSGIEEASLMDIRRQISEEQGRIEQIAQYLAKARDLMKRGYITMPIGENAVAELRSVQGIDPNNKEAAILLEKCAEMLANVAKDAYAYGFSEEAFDYLDLAIAIDPKQNSWAVLRTVWLKNRKI